MASTTVPKAILYAYPPSIWCSVPMLALHEKGYGPDEIDVKTVDLSKGEQYSLSYLRINPAGTVPTLVVPVESSLGPDEENRFRALKDSTTITEFIDKSRSANSRTHTTSSAPAPSLSPATMEGSNTSKSIIELVHDPKGADPNALKRSARTPAELEAGGKTNGPFFAARQAAIERSLAELGEGVTSRARKLLEERLATAKAGHDVWTNPSSTHRAAFLASGKALWEVQLPEAFAKLEKLIVGPYCLGDQLSIADLHVAAWLARVVSVCGGDASAADLVKVETKVGGDFKVGEKVKAFWAAIILRPSFKAVYKDGLH